MFAVLAVLSGRDDVALVLDRAGTQQHVPMGSPGTCGKGRGHGHRNGAAIDEFLIEGGEAYVVTDS